ncbi:hypothetical protein R3P38DRAFT_3206304 [Favolaschia claudopus]|uniref:Uncharacterized protein n=1 Tax=Favolaschia claudopus TaxID=2862362 RepID=A0AAW0ANT0_9AGAR
MTPANSGTERSAPEAANTEAINTAAAFETVLHALASVNLERVDARTLDAFQLVLDVVTSFDPATVSQLQVNAGSPSPSREVASATNQFFPSPPPIFPAPTPVASGSAAPAPAPTPTFVAAPAHPAAVPASPAFRTTGPWTVGELFWVIPPHPLTAVPERGEDVVWYCIYQGKQVGVTLNHGSALAATVGVSGGRMRSYKTQVAALQAFNNALAVHSIAVVP